MKAKSNVFGSSLLAAKDALPADPGERTLRVVAAFLHSAHLTKGRQREEARKLWKRLQSMPRLIAELKRRGLLTGMPKAP